MIKNLIIAAKFLKRQLVLNLIILIEVILSVVILTELFVYVSDRIDNQRAAKELYNDELYVLQEFEYYLPNEEDIIERLKADPAVKKAGSASALNCMADGRNLRLGLYDSDLIDLYRPKLSEGEWLSAYSGEYEACPAVVSSHTGLHAGSVTEILVANKETIKIQVAGVLASPTQYLLPTGMSNSIDSFISQQPVILLSSAQNPNLRQLLITDGAPIRVLFLLTDMTKDQLAAKYNKYGSIQSINDMIRRYIKDSNELIASEVLLFVLFFLLASIVILSTEVIHSMSCRKSYTIYYLLGMRWEKCVWIEFARHIVLIIIIIGISILMDKYGMLQTAWLSSGRHVLFYVLLFVYLIAIFFGTSAAFIRSLLHHDISVSLKTLNGGE